MEPKTLIKAEIRGIAVHLLQVSARSYVTHWGRIDTPVTHLLAADQGRRMDKACKANPGEARFYFKDHDTACTAGVAKKRFREICRAAQNKNVTFE